MHRKYLEEESSNVKDGEIFEGFFSPLSSLYLVVLLEISLEHILLS